MFQRHGLSETAEHHIWRQMRKRCMNPRATDYAYYGGRGITVCPEWDDFLVFLRDMGPRPSAEHSLDRFPDQNGSYRAGNVRWATCSEQNRNKRTNRIIEHNGERLPLCAWAARAGIHEDTFRDRLTRGMSLTEAMTRPLQTQYRRHRPTVPTLVEAQ